jgi:curved DNA-binding protein CbpA
MKNHYEELGVEKKATKEQIERAYLWLVPKFHPDRNEGFEEEAKARFVQIQEAFDILSDPVKRAQYDQELKSAWQYGAPVGTRAQPVAQREKFKKSSSRFWLSIAVCFMVLVVAGVALRSLFETRTSDAVLVNPFVKSANGAPIQP